MKTEALLYKSLDNEFLQCFLCAHRCRIGNNEFGLCGVRQNSDGVLYTHAYADIIAAHVDPIEKKPFFHFLPGSASFSLATIGCNFHCGFCQNWEISQQSFREKKLSEGKTLSSHQAVGFALEAGCKSISYTYTEPTIFFEYARDTGRIAKEKGLYNCFVTNGFMTAEALSLAKGWLDAANVDLKFFKDESYKKLCSGRLQPVLDSIKRMRDAGIWVEITTLVVPGENDSQDELAGIAGFIAGVDKEIPWHLSRFHPDFRFIDYDATAEETLKIGCRIGREAGLRYVYAGNVYGWGSETLCPDCSKPLIKRDIFTVLENNIDKGECPYCGRLIAGKF